MLLFFLLLLLLCRALLTMNVEIVVIGGIVVVVGRGAVDLLRAKFLATERNALALACVSEQDVALDPSAHLVVTDDRLLGGAQLVDRIVYDRICVL